MKKITIVLLLSFLFLSVYSQELKDLKKVEVISGQIYTNLPYGQAFLLKGKSTTWSGEKVDMIGISIIKGTKPGSDRKKRCKPCEECGENCCEFSKDPTKGFDAIWRRNEGDNSDSFEVFIAKKLEFASCYQVKLEYFVGADISSVDMEKVLDKIIDGYIARNEDFTMGPDDSLPEAFLDEIKRTLIDSLAIDIDGDSKFGVLDVKTRKIIAYDYDSFFSKGLNITKNDLGLMVNLALRVRSKKIIQADEKQLTDSKQKAIAELQRSQISLDTLFVVLEEIANSNSDILSIQDIDKLKNFAQKAEISDVNPLEHAKQLNLQIPDSLKPIFRKLNNHYSNISTGEIELEKEKEELKKLIQNNKKLNPKIRNTYLSIQQTTSNSAASPSSSTGLEKIRFSAPIGFGGVLYNPIKEERELNALQYLGIRYYFMPVDKGSVDNRYLGNDWPINRSSVAFGFLLGSDYDYRGQALDNAFTVKPFVNLGYDLSYFLTLDIGFMAFRQESTHPFDSSKKLRVAPSLGISLEFDVLNRVSAGIKEGKTYKIGE